MNKTIPKIVAHRGYAKKYPENSVLSISAAFELGACFVEIDIQCLKDGTVVIYHDDNMLRVSNVDKNIMSLSKEECLQYSASEPERFGEKFINNKISLLTDMVSVLKKYKNGKLLVELKDESLSQFGISRVVDNVYKDLQSVWDQIIIISYNLESLKYSRDKYTCEVAWVLTNWDEESHHLADDFKPEMIITNYKKIEFDKGGLWQGPWQWVTYEVVDPEHAFTLVAQGVDHIESMDIGGLLQDERLKLAACEH
ncbi:MAG: glycerophosphodiester phosphodiesterase family protein [Thiohalomonadales bacterium]